MSSTNSPSNLTSIVDLETAYKRADYDNKTARAASCIPHYLIALGEKRGAPQAQTLQYIENSNQFVKKLFLADEGADNLTPLMIAVIQDNEAVVDKLIDKARSYKRLKDVLNAQDRFGWTPLHFAALSSSKLYDKLIGYKANQNVLNRQNCTAQDLLKLAQRKTHLDYSTKVFLKSLSCEIYPLSSLTEQQIQETLGILYRDISYYPPSTFSDLRTQTATVESTFIDHLFFDLFKQMRENPPALCIQECTDLQGVVKDAKELVAMEEIPFSRLIGSYSGTYCSKKPDLLFDNSEKGFQSFMENRAAAYLLSPIFADEIGGALRFANAGFPNAHHVKVTVEGVPQSLFFSGGIRKSEPILYNYGPDMPYLGYGKQIVLGKEEMRQFFARGLDNVLKADTENTKARSKRKFQAQDLIEGELYGQRMVYPLTVPAAILDLHFNGIVSAKEWTTVIHSSLQECIDDFVAKNCLIMQVLLCFLGSLHDFDHALEQSGQKKKASLWVLDKVGSLTIIQIMKIFKSYSTGSDWDQFILEKEKWIETYDWKQDPNPPLSLQRVKDMYLTFFNGRSKKFQVDSLINMYRGIKKEAHYETSAQYAIIDYLNAHLFQSKTVDQLIELRQEILLELVQKTK